MNKNNMSILQSPVPSMEEGDSTADALLKLAQQSTSQYADVLSADTNYTGKSYSSILFLNDAMSITSITMPNVTGSLNGLSVDAGFYLPVQVTQIQVTGGIALGFKFNA